MFSKIAQSGFPLLRNCLLVTVRANHETGGENENGWKRLNGSSSRAEPLISSSASLLFLLPCLPAVCCCPSGQRDADHIDAQISQAAAHGLPCPAYVGPVRRRSGRCRHLLRVQAWVDAQCERGTGATAAAVAGTVAARCGSAGRAAAIETQADYQRSHAHPQPAGGRSATRRRHEVRERHTTKG